MAERVESHDVKMRSIGCDYGQGYLFGRPQHADEATLLLAGAIHETA